ncbi:MAG: MFS transporter [Saprospiraceae bacterium]|nr:MFS transporter [Saprospiraceae bacterium]
MIRTLKAFALHTPSLSVGLVFMSLSLLFGSWIARLPEVQSRLGLSEGTLGLALLGMSIGALISTPLSGWLMNRMSTGKATILSTLLLAIAFVFTPYASNFWMLFGLLILLGLANGFMNVSMNTAAASLEKNYRISIMSTCHGMFSLGGMIGAGSSGLVASLDIPLSIHISVVAGLVVLLSLAIRPMLLQVPDVGRQGGPALVLPSRGLARLVLIGFCVMLGEGAVADWSAVFLKNYRDSGPLLAGMGFAAFSLAMAMGRFLGDGFALQLGSGRVVRYGSLIGAAGMLLAVVVPFSAAAILGFFLVGAGFATIVPILFSQASKEAGATPGTAIASVATGGIIGFLVGPPLIGFIGEVAGLSAGFTFLALLALTASLLARSGQWHS